MQRGFSRRQKDVSRLLRERRNQLRARLESEKAKKPGRFYFPHDAERKSEKK